MPGVNKKRRKRRGGAKVNPKIGVLKTAAKKVWAYQVRKHGETQRKMDEGTWTKV